MKANLRIVALLLGGVLSLTAGLLFSRGLMPGARGDPMYLSGVSFAVGGIVTLVAILLILFGKARGQR
jgi:hypothetical protein